MERQESNLLERASKQTEWRLIHIDQCQEDPRLSAHARIWEISSEDKSEQTERSVTEVSMQTDPVVTTAQTKFSFFLNMIRKKSSDK